MSEAGAPGSLAGAVGRVSARALNACLQEAVRTAGPVVLTVRGDCMEPAFTDGETVEVLSALWYFPGDAVAYYSPFEDRYLVHRFLGYVRSGGTWKCLMKPDRASRPDTLIECSGILGKAVEHRVPAFSEAVIRRARAVWHYTYWVFRIALERRRSGAKADTGRLS